MYSSRSAMGLEKRRLRISFEVFDRVAHRDVRMRLDDEAHEFVVAEQQRPELFRLLHGFLKHHLRWEVFIQGGVFTPHSMRFPLPQHDLVADRLRYDWVSVGHLRVPVLLEIVHDHGGRNAALEGGCDAGCRERAHKHVGQDALRPHEELQDRDLYNPVIQVSVSFVPSDALTVHTFSIMLRPWRQRCSSRLRCEFTNGHKCFLFSRNIGKVTPKIIYFHFLIKYFLDQSIQKIIYLILKKEALMDTLGKMRSNTSAINVRCYKHSNTYETSQPCSVITSVGNSITHSYL